MMLDCLQHCSRCIIPDERCNLRLDCSRDVALINKANGGNDDYNEWWNGKYGIVRQRGAKAWRFVLRPVRESFLQKADRSGFHTCLASKRLNC
jgi:hypothetical protein